MRPSSSLRLAAGSRGSRWCYNRCPVSRRALREIVIRPLREEEIPAAERIFREAFAAQVGLPDPEQFSRGSEPVGFRWRMDPASVLAAELDGQLVGSNVATGWGSLGFFGPLTVRPDFWGAGIGGRLTEAAVEMLERRGCRHLVLYTFPESAKHIALYKRFGFWPRFLTAILERPLEGTSPAGGRWRPFSSYAGAEREEVLAACRELTDAVYPGLDTGAEIEALEAQRVGDTVVVPGTAGVDAFAVCHHGPGSEATAGTAFVKFAAARPGRGAGERFAALLAAVEDWAVARGAASVVAGVNLARERAWRILAGRGYRTFRQGVAMHRPNAAAYDRPDRYVIDDWR